MKGFPSSSSPAPFRRGVLLAGALGFVALVTSGSAAALTCGPVYSSQIINGGTFSPRLYQLNGTVATLDSTAGQNLDGIGQATDTNIYFDNGANTTIRRFTGAATTAFATNWTSFGGTPGSSGQGGGADGNVYYVGSDRHLYRVSTAGVNTDLGLVSAAAAADATIWANMSAGDLASDANGRLYWLGSSGSSSYLFRIDRATLQAYNLGVYGASGATGLAFNTAGLLVSTIITGNTTSVFTIDLGSPNTGGTVLGNATGYSNNGAALDLASCNAPTLNPALATTKSVANITRSQTPATFALPGDVLEYTVTVSNTGNLPAELVTLSDAIPANTTYVAGSTTLNGVAVADAPAGTMPYSPASSGTREIHSTGRPAGEVLAGGAGGAAVVRFRVTVGAAPLPATIDNQATASYFTVSGGASTPQTASSPLVQTPVPNPRLTLTKVTLGGFGGPFTFTGGNGWTPQSIATTAVGVGVSGTTQTFTATGVVTTITESAVPAGYALTALTCSNLPIGGAATVDLVARTVTFNAAAMVRGADIACTFTNTNLPRLTLVKTVTNNDGGTALPTAWTLSATGPATLSGATGSAAVTAVAVPVGTYALAESGGPATYDAGAWSCTAGTLSGANLTLAAGANAVCTINNDDQKIADVRITKTNTPGVNGEVDQTGDTVVSGAGTSYSIVVTNAGPSAANGTVVNDPATASLTCATATCSATGGAACPAQTGAALAAALQGAGATVPTLPAGGSVTFLLSCQVP